MPGLDRVIDPVTRDYVADDKGSWKTTTSIATAVYHQLTGEEGMWWGDATAGSQFFTLRRQRLNTRTFLRAKDIVRTALLPFIKQGLATDLEVHMDKDQNGRDCVVSSLRDVQRAEPLDLTPLLPFSE